MTQRHLIFLVVCLNSIHLWSNPLMPFNYLNQWELVNTLSWQEHPTNFDAAGVGYDELPEQHSYRRLQNHLGFRYAIGSWGLRVSGLYGWGQSQNETDSYQNGNIEKLGIGIERSFYFKNILMTPYVHYDSPLQPLQLNSDVLALSDGLSIMEAGVNLRTLRTPWPLWLRAHYQQRQAYAGLFHYQLQADLPFSFGFFQAGIEGFETVIDDSVSASSALARSSWACRVNGCSWVELGPNPRRTAARLGVTFGQAEQSQWGLSVLQAFSGRQTSRDTQVLLTFSLKGPVVSQFKNRVKFEEEVLVDDSDTLLNESQVINPVDSQQMSDNLEPVKVKQRKSKKNRR